ncbi:hypothetical protein AMTRI_Chr10g820 [Amborella trichopoda]
MEAFRVVLTLVVLIAVCECGVTGMESEAGRGVTCTCCRSSWAICQVLHSAFVLICGNAALTGVKLVRALEGIRKGHNVNAWIPSNISHRVVRISCLIYWN